MRLMRLNAKAAYAPGKTLLIADALSHNTADTDVACYVNVFTHS